MSASRARASVQQPDATDRISETLRTVAADPAPANASPWEWTAPPEAYVQARRVHSDGSISSRKTALYLIGCEQGREAARAYLLSPPRPNPRTGMCTLPGLVLEMVDTPHHNLRAGRIMGFFHALERGLFDRGLLA